jgi:putative hemolysin
MADVTTEILVIFGLLVLNGLFAMSEIAIVSARKTRLQHRANQGDEKARVALQLASAPDYFLATVQVGITLVGILAGAFGGAVLADRLAAALARVPWLAHHSQGIALAIVVAGITYASVVIGELVPKNIALAHPEAIARAVARPMRWLSRIGYPAIAVLRGSSGGVMRLLRMRAVAPVPVSEEEFKIMLDQGARAGVFERVETTLVERVFRLGDRRVGSLMTPRTEITWVDTNAPIGESMRTMSAGGHTYYPLCQGNIDNVLGVVSVKNQWARMVHRLAPDLREGVVTVPFVPEAMPALKLLETYRLAGRHVAVVVDEYGGVAGLVTLADVMEALVGDIPSGEAHDDTAVVTREDGSHLIDGMLAVEEMQDILEMKELPGEPGEYQTLAGFCMHQLGRIPRMADHFEWGGYRFEVVDMDGHRVDRVLVAPAGTGAPPTVQDPTTGPRAS